MIADTKPEYNLTVFGYPIWQTQGDSDEEKQYYEKNLEHYHALNTYIFSYFFADNIHPSVKAFYDKYKYWYSKSPETLYALLGYDTGMYFLSALQQFGTDFETRLSELNYKSLQTGFNFERLNDEGGFINKNLYIIHYNKDYSVTRSEYK